jgi:hypothetical protein
MRKWLRWLLDKEERLRQSDRERLPVYAVHNGLDRAPEWMGQASSLAEAVRWCEEAQYRVMAGGDRVGNAWMIPVDPNYSANTAR